MQINPGPEDFAYFYPMHWTDYEIVHVRVFGFLSGPIHDHSFGSIFDNFGVQLPIAFWKKRFLGAEQPEVVYVLWNFNCLGETVT